MAFVAELARALVPARLLVDYCCKGLLPEPIGPLLAHLQYVRELALLACCHSSAGGETTSAAGERVFATLKAALRVLYFQYGLAIKLFFVTF